MLNHWIAPAFTSSGELLTDDAPDLREELQRLALAQLAGWLQGLLQTTGQAGDYVAAALSGLAVPCLIRDHERFAAHPWVIEVVATAHGTVGYMRIKQQSPPTDYTCRQRHEGRKQNDQTASLRISALGFRTQSLGYLAQRCVYPALT